MWTCPSCGEELEDNYTACWKCGTSLDGVRTDGFAPEEGSEGFQHESAANTEDSSEKTLRDLLELQRKQSEALEDVQTKVGCLYSYMMAGILIGILSFFYFVYGR